METNFIHFDTFIEWFNHLCSLINKGHKIQVINSDSFDAEDSNDKFLDFYNDENKNHITDILTLLRNKYRDTICVESDTATFEDECGEDIHYTYLNVCLN